MCIIEPWLLSVTQWQIQMRRIKQGLFMIYEKATSAFIGFCNWVNTQHPVEGILNN